MKIKITINREQPSLSEINSGKNFSALLNAYNAFKIPFYKTKLFLGLSTVLTTALLSLTVYYFTVTDNYKPVIQAKTTIKYDTASIIQGVFNGIDGNEKNFKAEKKYPITHNSTRQVNIKPESNSGISDKSNVIAQDRTKLVSEKNYDVNIYAHLNGKMNGKIDYNNIIQQPHLKTNADTVNVVSFFISYISKNNKHRKFINGNAIPQYVLDDLKNMINGDKLSITEIKAVTKSGREINLNDLNYTLTGTYLNKNETGVLEDELFEK